MSGQVGEGSGRALSENVIRIKAGTRHTAIMTHSGLDVGLRLARGEAASGDLSGGRNGDDVRAVDQIVRVLTDGCKLGHDGLEFGHHVGVVGWR